MNKRLHSSVREFERWLSASIAEAEGVVPDLLDLPARLLRQEIRLRRELRTVGVMRRLVNVAHDALERYPSRAYELTAIVTRYASSVQVPLAFEHVARTLHGEAWREHAAALHALGRKAQARRAIGTARTFFADTPREVWLLGTADLVEAPLLHECGRRGEALEVVRQAAERFGVARDHGRYVEARMLECWMLRLAGDPAGVEQAWRAMHEGARDRRDHGIMARIAAKLGRLELREGSPDEAARLLKHALALFEATGSNEEAIHVRGDLAEAMAVLGRVHEAISEYHKVRAELLDRGSLTDAALAAAATVDLYLTAQRDEELPALTATLATTFRDAGLPMQALEPFGYLWGQARNGRLTHEDVVCVRRFFEDLPLRPRARFRAP